jgi:hypothetical protein
VPVGDSAHPRFGSGVGLRTVLALQRVGDQHHFDAAGFPAGPSARRQAGKTKGGG